MAPRPAPAARTPTELLEFGVVVLDKPAGPTSHQVTEWVADLTRVDRAGHVGTLDPNVTGCLPVLLGTSTRLTSVLAGADKEYVAVLELHADPPADWRARIASFEGPIHQRPPRKSAVARRLRVRTVHALEVVERADRRVLLRIGCEAGTYIRKLCHDLGLVLGTGAHMASLRRTASTPFDDSQLVTLHDLADGLAFWREDDETDALRGVIRPAEDAVAHLPVVVISPDTAEAVADGAPVFAPGVVEVAEGLATPGEGTPRVVCTTPEGSAVCIGRLVGDPDASAGTVVELERVLV